MTLNFIVFLFVFFAFAIFSNHSCWWYGLRTLFIYTRPDEIFKALRNWSICIPWMLYAIWPLGIINLICALSLHSGYETSLFRYVHPSVCLYICQYDKSRHCQPMPIQHRHLMCKFFIWKNFCPILHPAPRQSVAEYAKTLKNFLEFVIKI